MFEILGKGITHIFTVVKIQCSTVDLDHPQPRLRCFIETGAEIAEFIIDVNVHHLARGWDAFPILVYLAAELVLGLPGGSVEIGIDFLKLLRNWSALLDTHVLRHKLGVPWPKDLPSINVAKETTSFAANAGQYLAPLIVEWAACELIGQHYEPILKKKEERLEALGKNNDKLLALRNVLPTEHPILLDN